MSYILDTLKKLDKEKAEFQNKLNLKELIVKDDFEEANAVRSLKKRNYLLTLLASVFALFFIYNFYRLNYSNTTISTPPAIKALKEADLSKQTPNNPIKNSTERFIPSPNLPGKALEPLDVKQSPDNKTNAANSFETQSATEIKTDSSPNKKIKEKLTTQAVTLSQQDSGQLQQKKEKIKNAELTFTSNEVFDRNKVDQPPDQNNQFTQKKYLPTALVDPAEMESGNKKPDNRLPSRVILQESLPQDISDLEINGIIFFGTDNPLNYALGSYKGNDQMKMTAGDRLNEVEILEIRPEKIIFTFQDKIFEKKLGN